jgi:diguanylate cyclase (GGDEF)-like protein
VDLDGLRRINDRFGHVEGDHCLQQAARAMEESARSSDRCFRWGGDEFVVVLPARTTRARRECWRAWPRAWAASASTTTTVRRRRPCGRSPAARIT